MWDLPFWGCDRRAFVARGLQGLALASAPSCLSLLPRSADAAEPAPGGSIRPVVRDEVLFAGIRKPITKRGDLEPRVTLLEKACGDKVAGPLTHIFRFDTPVDGYDSEIGFPVSAPVDTDQITTHRLRTMHFFAGIHEGPVETLRETSRKVYDYMSSRGLSPELELVEVYHGRGATLAASTRIEVMASYLAWPEVYQAQLVRVLGAQAAAEIWKGGEGVTPHMPVDPRAAWVGASIERLKQRSTLDQQFDVLSRVALVRPTEDVEHYKKIYDESKDITAIFRAEDERLKQTPTGGYVDPLRYDGKVLHVSKVPYNGAAYLAAKTPEEKRKAYCFCALVREASDPKIDPIFCYRAAGWARQFWEPILGVEFSRCVITHSILKGDPFCAWDYGLEEPEATAPRQAT